MNDHETLCPGTVFARRGDEFKVVRVIGSTVTARDGSGHLRRFHVDDVQKSVAAVASRSSADAIARACASLGIPELIGHDQPSTKAAVEGCFHRNDAILREQIPLRSGVAGGRHSIGRPITIPDSEPPQAA